MGAVAAKVGEEAPAACRDLMPSTKGATVVDMARADSAEVFWEPNRKAWMVRIRAGEEAIRRSCKDAKRDADDDALRSLAVQTAHDEGYELAMDAVSVKR